MVYFGPESHLIMTLLEGALIRCYNSWARRGRLPFKLGGMLLIESSYVTLLVCVVALTFSARAAAPSMLACSLTPSMLVRSLALSLLVCAVAPTMIVGAVVSSILDGCSLALSLLACAVAMTLLKCEIVSPLLVILVTLPLLAFSAAPTMMVSGSLMSAGFIFLQRIARNRARFLKAN